MYKQSFVKGIWLIPYQMINNHFNLYSKNRIDGTFKAFSLDKTKDNKLFRTRFIIKAAIYGYYRFIYPRLDFKQLLVNLFFLFLVF